MVEVTLTDLFSANLVNIHLKICVSKNKCQMPQVYPIYTLQCSLDYDKKRANKKALAYKRQDKFSN